MEPNFKTDRAASWGLCPFRSQTCGPCVWRAAVFRGGGAGRAAGPAVEAAVGLCFVPPRGVTALASVTRPSPADGSDAGPARRCSDSHGFIDVTRGLPIGSPAGARGREFLQGQGGWARRPRRAVRPPLTLAAASPGAGASPRGLAQRRAGPVSACGGRFQPCGQGQRGRRGAR